MNDLLHAASGAICIWLGRRLPRLSSNWWKAHVLERLTFQQQRLVQERKVDALSKLDFAAALRVLDQNWSEIAALETLPREGRNWVKELQLARNRWAHASAEGIPPIDAFRDADTLFRLLAILDVDAALLACVRAFRDKSLAAANAAGAPQIREEPADDARNSSGTAANSHKFALGQLVSLRSNPATVFPIIEVLPPTAGEARYRVFEAGARQLYYESQLCELSVDDH